MAKNREAIAIYSRKSKFTGKGESIGNQIDMCKEYVKNFYGPEYLDKIVIFEDEGYSGGNLYRPDFQRMIQAVRRHEFKAIIVYRLDRISRNISDFTSLIDELTKLDVSFVSIREQFDTSTPMGRAMMFIISVFSQLERETIAERIRDNMHELAKTGRWLGGTTPTGFKSESETTVTVDGKSRKAYKLAPISKEVQLVQYIFDLFRELDSLTGTESKLLQLGIKSKTGNDFSRYSLRQILLNPVYMVADEDAFNFFKEHGADICSSKEAIDGSGAIMAYNRTNQEKGRSTQFLPISEWVISIGKHQGIIPSKQWIQTYNALNLNKEKSYRKPRSNVALLTGLIFCECGSRMYPKVTERKMLNGEIIYSYYCKMKERSKRSRCNLRNPNGNILDSAILEQLKMLASDDKFFIAEMERVRRFYKSNRDKYDDELIDCRKELAENERKISGLVDSMIMVGEAVAKRHISNRIEELDSRNKVLQSKITELEAIISMQALGDKDFDSLVKMLSVFRENIDDLPLEYKKRMIKNVVRKVVWDGVYVHVYLFGDKDNPIEFPDVPSYINSTQEPSDSSKPENEEDIFVDEDVFDDDEEEELSINPTIPNGCKSRWGEDSIFCASGRIGSQPGSF